MPSVTQFGGAPEKAENLSPGLLRQRRNLVVLATFLILFDVSTVEPKTLTLFGAELGLPRARTYATFAWILLLYFVWRFYQYLQDESDLDLKKRRTWSKAKEYLEPWLKESGASLLTMAQGQYELNQERFGGWFYRFAMYDPKQGKHLYETLDVPFATTIWATVKALMYTTFRTPYVTDILLPILLAIVAPVLFLCQLF